MSFQKRRPHRVQWPQSPGLDSTPLADVPEGARDQLSRIVHARRAAKLRKRGVELCLEPGCYVWHESVHSWVNRQMKHAVLKALRKDTPIPYADTIRPLAVGSLNGFERTEALYYAMCVKLDQFNPDVEL